MASVLAAIDLSDGNSRRVLQHAAGFARLLKLPLRVMHVASDCSAASRQQVADFCARLGPYEVDVDEEDIVIRTGLVSEAIHREAAKLKAALIVMGSRGHSRFAAVLLGSTCRAVLRNAAAPVLLVPPIDIDIINISDGVRLTCGPVLAAVDLGEAGAAQLRMASEMASLSGQPLLLMTVGAAYRDDHKTMTMLRERAHGSAPVKPRAMIVRRGNIAEEISRCALAEGAGLVVMGLRPRGRGQPGAIAAAVLRSNRAFVLAVPAA